MIEPVLDVPLLTIEVASLHIVTGFTETSGEEPAFARNYFAVRPAPTAR